MTQKERRKERKARGPTGKSGATRAGRAGGAGQRDDLVEAKLRTPDHSVRSSKRPSLSWKLEDAKAKFSEVVRRARDEGPQFVTVRGQPAVAIIDAAELERLLPADGASLPFVQFMESLYVEGLKLERDADIGRDVDL